MKITVAMEMANAGKAAAGAKLVPQMLAYAAGTSKTKATARHFCQAKTSYSA
jgi:hypothetical protein